MTGLAVTNLAGQHLSLEHNSIPDSLSIEQMCSLVIGRPKVSPIYTLSVSFTTLTDTTAGDKQQVVEEVRLPLDRR